MNNCCKDKHYPPNADGTPYIRCGTCDRDLSEQPKLRSKDLNAAYWAWLTEVARDCENRGITLPMILEKMHHLEVIPTKKNLHETLSISYIQQQCQKNSSADLSTGEMQQLIDALTLFFGTYFDCDIPFDPQQFLAHYDKVLN